MISGKRRDATDRQLLESICDRMVAIDTDIKSIMSALRVICRGRALAEEAVKLGVILDRFSSAPPGILEGTSVDEPQPIARKSPRGDS